MIKVKTIPATSLSDYEHGYRSTKHIINAYSAMLIMKRTDLSNL